MNEEWRAVIGFEGLYEVSDHGEVRRILARNGERIERSCAIATSDGLGYPMVQLWKSNQHFSKYVHELVARAHIGPRPDGYVMNHKDGVKTNNRLENLEWVTYSQNNQHAYDTGLKPDRGIYLTCAGCGERFRLAPWRLRERQATGQKAFFCSSLCYHSAPLVQEHRDRIGNGLRRAYAEGRR